MNWLVYHIVSGQAFYSGVALLIVAAFASTRSMPVFRRVTALSFLIGITAVVVSSTAIPYWYYALTGVITVVWMASKWRKQWRRWTPYAFIMVWLVAGLMELPYHVTHSLLPVSERKITVIGDSVTAGVDGDEKSETWPRLLARLHHVAVQDISHIGETAASALKRTKSHPITSPVVVVEIGGNDVLGTTTTSQFATDLEALLSNIAAPDRQIVMFELPLPPFYHEYGRIQRTIAARHHVTLIPKRVFLSVIADNDSTLDSIHLSQSGHQRMADTVWQSVGSAFDSVP